MLLYWFFQRAIPILGVANAANSNEVNPPAVIAISLFKIIGKIFVVFSIKLIFSELFFATSFIKSILS